MENTCYFGHISVCKMGTVLVMSVDFSFGYVRAFRTAVSWECRHGLRATTPVDCGPGSSIDIATELPGWTVQDRIPVWTRFSARPDRPWSPPNLL